MIKLTFAQQDFVDNLVASLEKEQLPWLATWDRSISRPYNATSNKNYQGINELNLFMKSLQYGYDDPRWMTFKQANEKGYQIKQGSVGSYVFNFALRNLETGKLITFEEYNELTEEEKGKVKPFSKSYKVFNAAQINGIPALDIKSKQIIFNNEKAALYSDTLLKNINLKVEHGGTRAFYQPQNDMIQIPPTKTFMDEQSYYAVLMHETAHATMHPSRLDRDAQGIKGSEKYAIEELRAELTSAFMTLDIGFHFDQFHEKNHHAYIQNWIKVIKDNPKAIFSAISDAQKIREYMLDKGEYEKIYHEQEQSKDIVLFHGSPNNFKEFEFNNIGQNNTANGFGFYFANSKELANSYSENGFIYEVSFSPKKELNYNSISLTENELKIILGNLSEEQQEDIFYNWDENLSVGKEKCIRSLLEMSSNDVEIIGDLVHQTNDIESVLNAFSKNGYTHYIKEYETTDKEYIVIDKEALKINNVINLCEVQQNEKEANAASEEHSFQNSGDERNTVVINLFAGPGAGKTTCSWEIASELKKMGYVTEYVPEYAKELVWDDKRELLDGTLEHQQMLLNEQEHRVERLVGKVDFIVTDSPSLLNLNFLKCDDQELADQYKDKVMQKFKQHNNFNLFINRGNAYETVGRVHTLEESIILDGSIKNILEENHLYYGTYDHSSVKTAINNCIKTYDRYNPNDKINTQKEEMKENVSQTKQISLDDLKNSVGIVDYARNVLGMNVIKESRGKYRIEEHDSCKIYPNNTFYRFSRGVGGSIVDFIKHFEECDTKEAIEKIQNYYEKYSPETQFDSTSKKQSNKNMKDMELPEKAENNKHIYAYLTKTRGIKPSVVKDMINRKILYEDIYKNCVWVGKLNGTITYATLRSSNQRSSFKQDVVGSIKETGIYVDNGSDTLIVNEAAIDQMSYMSLTENPNAYNYLSVCGAANCKNAVRLHMLKRAEAQNLKRIIIGLDNDPAGEENTMKTLDYLKESYPDVDIIVHLPEANDFNDDLKNELNILYAAEPETTSIESDVVPA